MSIEYETITTSGVAMYCDKCGTRGAQAPGDDRDEVIELSQSSGWTLGDADEDLCPKCSAVAA